MPKPLRFRQVRIPTNGARRSAAETSMNPLDPGSAHGVPYMVPLGSAPHRSASVDLSRDDETVRRLQEQLHIATENAEGLGLRCNALAAALNDQTQALDHLRSEAALLKQQNLDLKRAISRSSRVDSQLTDDAIRDLVGKLLFDIQNWAINNFRRFKVVNTSELDPDAQRMLATLVSDPQSSCSAYRIAVFRALIMRSFAAIFYDDLYYSLPPGGKYDQLRAVFDAYEEPSEAFNKWRAATVALVHQLDDESIAEHTHQRIMSICARAEDILMQLTEAGPSDARSRDLLQLASSAVHLARILRSQRAVFKIYYPSPAFDIAFDKELMEDISAEDIPDDQDRKVILCLSPAVLKSGDEQGGRADLQNVIFKSHVLCDDG